MKTIYSVYDEVAEMIARLGPEKILAMRPSLEMQARFDFLVDQSKNAVISPREKDELDHFIVLERLFRLAKIRADDQISPYA